MKKPTTLTAVVPAANIEEAWQEVGASSATAQPHVIAGPDAANAAPS